MLLFGDQQIAERAANSPSRAVDSVQEDKQADSIQFDLLVMNSGPALPARAVTPLICCAAVPVSNEGFWCQGELSVEVRSSDFVANFVVHKPYARIGSHPHAEVRLPGLEKRSLLLLAMNEGIVCRRLSLAEEPAPRCGLWPASQPVCLGDYRLTATLLLTATDRIAAQRPNEHADIRASSLPLRVTLGGREVSQRNLKPGLYIVGRASPSTLIIRRGMVSACHCVLYWSGQAAWVIDLMSGNGTLLNGRCIEASPLSAGDELRVGEAVLTFFSPTEVERMPRSGNGRPSNAAGNGRLCAAGAGSTPRKSRDGTSGVPQEGREDGLPPPCPDSAEAVTANMAELERKLLERERELEFREKAIAFREQQLKRESAQQTAQALAPLVDELMGDLPELCSTLREDSLQDAANRTLTVVAHPVVEVLRQPKLPSSIRGCQPKGITPLSSPSELEKRVAERLGKRKSDMWWRRMLFIWSVLIILGLGAVGACIVATS